MMRSIHPLYLLGLLVSILFMLVWQNAKLEKEISYTQSERAKARLMAQRIVDLKKVIKTANKAQLNRFFKGSVFVGAELSHKVKNQRYIINAKNMSSKQLQTFLNRILNMSVNIMQLKIERKDDKHASLYMEISL